MAYSTCDMMGKAGKQVKLEPRPDSEGRGPKDFCTVSGAIIITRKGYRDSRRIPMIHAIVTVDVERRDHYL